MFIATAKCQELRDELGLYKDQLFQLQKELDAAAKCNMALSQRLEIVQGERAAKVQEYENDLIEARDQQMIVEIASSDHDLVLVIQFAPPVSGIWVTRSLNLQLKTSKWPKMDGLTAHQLIADKQLSRSHKESFAFPQMWSSSNGVFCAYSTAPPITWARVT